MAAAVLSAEFYDNVTIKQTHYHDGHQLLFVIGGTATVHVNQTEYCVGAGDLMIFSRLEQHAVTDQSPDYQRFVLELSPDLSALNRDAYRLYAILLNRPAGFCNRVDVRDQQAEFYRLFAAIQQELQHPRTMYEEMLELLVRQLLVQIYRQAQEAFSAMEGAGLELVYSIQMRFHQELQKDFSLSRLAEEHNLSASYLSHMFKSATGNSVMGYLQSCRIAEAKKCLAQTDMRIGEIVEHCGFSDSSNFSRTFRTVTGLSPSEFRKQYYK